MSSSSLCGGSEIKYESSQTTNGNTDVSSIEGGFSSMGSTGSENYDQQIQAPKYGTVVANRVFVGGLSTNTTESELTETFGPYGNIKDTKIIFDRGGISKGYGFVTFETEVEAKSLYNRLYNKELEPIMIRNRRLNVAPAVKKQAQMVHPEVNFATHLEQQQQQQQQAIPVYQTNGPAPTFCCPAGLHGGGGKFFQPQQIQMIPKHFIPAQNGQLTPTGGYSIQQQKQTAPGPGTVSLPPNWNGAYCYVTTAPPQQQYQTYPPQGMDARSAAEVLGCLPQNLQATIALFPNSSFIWPPMSSNMSSQQSNSPAITDSSNNHQNYQFIAIDHESGNSAGLTSENYEELSSLLMASNSSNSG